VFEGRSSGAGGGAEKLQRRWSPQQIAGWLKLTYPEDPEMHVSHESIYQCLRAWEGGLVLAGYGLLQAAAGALFSIRRDVT